VATPGRMIDIVRNAQSVTLEDIEILILDEADRLLDMGFKDEVEELVDLCPRQRQTMLFSATMSRTIESLVTKALVDPVQLKADPMFDVASTLSQQFVRVRQSKDVLQYREAILLALCRRSFKSKAIIFFREKKQAHRIAILFGFCGLKAAELHGNLTQLQRLESLEKFREQQADYLLCTDVASRGIDIIGVETVLNFDMPKDLTVYVHRVGRTARAGKTGLACSIVGDKDRKMMRDITKHAHSKVQARTVSPSVIDQHVEMIEEQQKKIDDVLDQEAQEKVLRKAELEIQVAQNKIEFQGEIHSRPKRTWFQTEAQKREIKEKSNTYYKESSESRVEQRDVEENKEQKKKLIGGQRKQRKEMEANEKKLQNQKLAKKLSRKGALQLSGQKKRRRNNDRETIRRKPSSTTNEFGGPKNFKSKARYKRK